MRSINAKVIRLFSPVPPMRTGTANYFATILEYLAGHFPYPEMVEVVTDFSMLDVEQSAKVDELIFRCVDYRSVPNFVSENELRFYFLANNDYHAFIYRALSLLDDDCPGHVVCVVHEPSCFMITNKLCGDGTYSFDRAQQLTAAQTQYGQKAGKIISDLAAGNLPPLVEYVSIGFDFLFKSDEVWVHSLFAAEKLMFESRVSKENMPDIKVLSHPLYSSSAEVVKNPGEALERRTKFRIGAFGWVAPSKRILELLEALGLFLDRISIDARKDVELIIVGKLPFRHQYDVAGHISRFDLDENVKLYDFVDNEEFARLVSSCDLISNLRYPSCGESSGTLSYAHASGAKTITTNYQSFAGEVSDLRAPVIYGFEVILLANYLMQSYATWAAAVPQISSSENYELEHLPTSPASTEKIVMLKCLMHVEM